MNKNFCNEYDIGLELLNKWYADPASFIEDILDVKLKWYQKIYLKIFMRCRYEI